MMISGFGGSSRPGYVQHGEKHGLVGLPVPFNIPTVLHNLLFEDVGLELDSKQKDMLETLQFSYNSLVKLQENHAKREQEIRQEMIEEPANMALQSELSDMQLDMLQANFQFKDIVTTMSDLLNREQYEKLLKFSNISI